MSEENVRELSMELAEKQIRQAKLKREKYIGPEIVTLESEILRLKRKINEELVLLSQEETYHIDVETDDTQRNR